MSKLFSWPSSLTSAWFSSSGNGFTLESRFYRPETWVGAWSRSYSGGDLREGARAEEDDQTGGANGTALASVSIIALVGLAFEARIVAGPGVLVMCRGTNTNAEVLPRAMRNGCRGIISFGVAGGLVPDLVPGDCVVASEVVDFRGSHRTDAAWSRKLLKMVPSARHAPIAGVNTVVSDPADKRKLHAATGAAAVDMESHLVARLADLHGLSFAAVRVIVDPADRMVPPAARLAMAPGGGTDLSSMLWEIAARPSQLAALLRIAADAYAARIALVRLRHVLGPYFRCG